MNIAGSVCSRVLFALSLATVGTVFADTLTFQPTKDAMVKFKFPDQNFGSDPLLQVSNQSGFQKHIYIQFTVSGIPTGATNIVSKLHLNSQTTGTGRSVSAHAVTNTSWGEATITWNNAPVLGTSLATVSSFTSGQDGVWDVSAHASGNGTFALGLDTTYTAGDTTFASSESTPVPSLVVTYTPASGGTLATSPVSGTPGFSSSTWQPPPDNHKNDGRVDAILQAGSVVYIGSDADQTWQGGTMRTDMPHLVAYNLNTGQLITTWKPAPNGRIYDIKLSADGTKLWVCGEFTTICGTSRKEIAVLNALTGPGDTSPATLSSQLNLTPAGGDGTIRSIVLDESHNRAWIGGSFTSIGGTTRNGVAKLAWNGTTWSLDTTFNPGTTINVAGGAPNSTFGVVRTMVLKPDGTKLVVGGIFLWTSPNTKGYMAAFNPDTGATLTWNHTFIYDDPTKETPGIFDVAGDANCVYLSGGYNSANITVCTDWNGGGPNSLTPLALNTPKTFNANWFYASDGNNQCMILAVINGTNVCLSGSHGDFVASAKNRNDAGSGTHIASGKIYAVTAGASGGALQAYGNPPSFTALNNTGSPLGPWSFYYDAPSGSLHVGGDFTGVNNDAANAHRRYARFDAQ